jgi:hypothetical protein
VSGRRSLLHQRLITPGGTAPASWHPYGTKATPMLMPLAEVAYHQGLGTYDELYPSPPATGDPNAVPLAVVAPGTWGTVRAAGRP